MVMQLHAALRDDPSFLGTLKRQLSRRGSITTKKANRERSASSVNDTSATNNNKHPRPSLLSLDMSKRVDWHARSEAWLDEPATRPAQTMLLIEIPDLQSICLNHGERLFRIEKTQPITVRDILIELDKFLHRPAPKLVGNFRTWKKTTDEEEGLEQPRSPKAVDLDVDVTVETPDSSESSLSSNGGNGSGSGEKKPAESVLTRWLGEKTFFAGLKRAENHDFKLLVKMDTPH